MCVHDDLVEYNNITPSLRKGSTTNLPHESLWRPASSLLSVSPSIITSRGSAQFEFVIILAGGGAARA